MDAADKGLFPISDKICKSVKLYNWLLFGPLLIGELPLCLANIPIFYLRLSGTGLHGPAWPVLTSSHLVAVQLNGNSFTGTVPQSLSNATLLELFDVQGNLLTGALPDLTSSDVLYVANLKGNAFTSVKGFRGSRLK
eukprot:4828590-Amphidinium_carterae.1